MDENQFVDVMMLSALTAFGRASAHKFKVGLTLEQYSEAGRQMWMERFLVGYSWIYKIL